MVKPPATADLTWTHDLVYEATSGTESMTIDGDSREGPSPVQLLAIALAGCMSVDVAHVLRKGRHPVRAIRSRIVADRAPDDPHRFLRVSLEFSVEGAVAPDVVARAIALSRDKYCSVWHSMREDIALTTAYDVRP
jgi:putative redox protein